MTWEQLKEWWMFAAIEPFGEYRADLRAGIITAAYVNVHRRKGTKAAKPTDFMPDFERRIIKKQARWESATKEQFADFKSLMIAIATDGKETKPRPKTT